MLRALPKLPTRLANTRAYSVKFSQNFDGLMPEPKKPSLKDFKYPLFHTFLLASATFMGLNTLWYSLEYEQVEEQLKAKSRALEAEMQAALDGVREDIQKSSSSWSSRFLFWKKP